MAWMLKVLPAGSGKNCVKMAKIIIDREKCKGCFVCIDACPSGSLLKDSGLNKRGVQPVKHKDGAPCTGCGMCAVVCPDGAIRVYRVKGDGH